MCVCACFFCFFCFFCRVVVVGARGGDLAFIGLCRFKGLRLDGPRVYLWGLSIGSYGI